MNLDQLDSRSQYVFVLPATDAFCADLDRRGVRNMRREADGQVFVLGTPERVRMLSRLQGVRGTVPYYQCRLVDAFLGREPHDWVSLR